MADTVGVERLRALLLANHDGRAVGVPSVCTAEPFVLRTALAQAQAVGGLALVESTCNQVNQEGGYTGMTPADFRWLVDRLAAEEGLAPDALVVGGDHLGPYPWRREPAQAAMAKARELVRACVLAGYTKIHLDPSMPLGDDDGALDDETVVERTVQLCVAAENARLQLAPDAPPPVYVIGTEVPVPGGEQAGAEGPSPSRADDVRRFLSTAEQAFGAAGLDDAWRRVVAVVTQPGVEFGEWDVADYRPERARELTGLLDDVPALVYEAHSTDYQSEAALAALVRDHFAILKVGPGLTFALREALFALEAIERELLPGGRLGPVEPSRLRETLDAAMLADPSEWRPYHEGDEAAQALARAFSYSDRSRYYWPQPEVQGARDRLLRNLSARPIPAALLAQYLPGEYAAVRAGQIEATVPELLAHHLEGVLRAYWAACGSS